MNALNEGAHVGRYLLLAPLPATEGADVWLARGDDSGETPLVLSTVASAVTSQIDRLRATAEEAASAQLFEHPHLVRFVDFFAVDGQWFVVSEFVSGRTLRQIMNRAATINRVPPIWFSVHVAAVVCQALDYLHARCGELGTELGHLRHPVSPDSVMVSFAGDPQLLAFGIAPALAPRVSNPNPVPSLLTYLAPERVLEGAPVVDVARADVYSLGVVLYEMLTGQRPFQATTDETLWREILERQREPTPPSRVAPWVTKPLEDIVLMAMAPQPEDRFRHARELGDAIKQYMAWAGLNPSRKHLAQQVCGVVAHADSAPPPSARSNPSPVVPQVPRAARLPAELSEREARGDEAPPHVWDRVTAMARQQRAAVQRGATDADDGPRPGHAGHPWDRVVAGAPESERGPIDAEAVRLFEEGVDLARSRDYQAALVKLEEAVRLDPDNRVYGANLRRVKKQLQGL